MIHFRFLIFLIFLVFRLNAHIAFQGVTFDDETVARLVTVITSTSPVQSMPDTKHLYPAQKSLHMIPALAKCKKIIVFDKIKETDGHLKENYRKYKKNVRKLVKEDPYFANTRLVFCKEWGHLSGTVKEAIKHVETPFIFLHQHDLQLVQSFDFNAVVATMVANPSVKYVHFSSTPNAPEHWYFGATQESEDFFIPLCRTVGWSDQCHIARVDYYQNFVLPQCHQTFMESVIIKNAREDFATNGWAAHQAYGNYLYGKLDEGPFIVHTDARNH